ncbi:YihY/virulence factor BrkB family protein [Subsaximicrobium wynnwilliamsii]|uniref:YihY/virulence factor BrkB family protein n=1 Tax=Subsaximicrobium wynnwilliamsii TaxID=291179 RepID=A0A5C6ZII3_9FLAO|nr:YihY/virulence factor BrkB family protein [Subsaximicrobium wynnwilliamsii]TXD84052.1 YihY/virulence factor BrkB family protein [Subsaximicrobium wynnwilliamsii]TXD88990.1 YihY/virulence factor BrkB family protein [Subsaximicrobium wynnwilliamsii]TXE03764.1 YihY/virulence factor BrkB family protein [Subsaximicrobium wynnwilliamsii]
MVSKALSLKNIPKLMGKTAKVWFNDEPFRLSAIIAYYAILSLPALIIIIMNVVGGIWGKEIVQGELLGEISEAIGTEAAESIRMMIVDQGDKSTSLFATIVGIGTLLYGATGVFFQLQESFDKIWKTKPKYTNGIIATIMSRLKSIGFILILGFLLLVSFVLTSLLSTFSNRLELFLPEKLLKYVFIFDILISLGFIYVLFGAMFKFLPSKPISWKAVRVGAAITAILFIIGKYLLAIYFSTMQPGSTYGAAGSIILVMLWVSYSSLILFYGAHFTKVYADEYGLSIDNNDDEALDEALEEIN